MLQHRALQAAPKLVLAVLVTPILCQSPVPELQHGAGVLCMHGHQLSKKEQERLADALQHRALQLCPDASLAVPVTAVLWMGAADDTVSEQEKVRSHRGSQSLLSTLAWAPGSSTYRHTAIRRLKSGKP